MALHANTSSTAAPDDQSRGGPSSSGAAAPLVVPIALYSHERDATPKVLTAPWPVLAQTLVDVHRTPCTVSTCRGKTCSYKMNRHPCAVAGCTGKCRHKPLVWRPDLAGGWSPVEIVAGRGNRNIRGVHLLVLDLDAGDVFGAVARVRAAGLAGVVHSSHSHRDGDPHLRIVLCVSRPMAIDEYHRVRRGACDRFAIPADEAAKALANMFFFPSAPSDAPVYTEILHGAPVDVDAVLATVPAEPERDFEQREPVEYVEVGDDAVLQAVQVLAAGWPRAGRHLASRALCGALARWSWPLELIAQFAEAVSEFADPGNGDYSKRLDFAVRAYELIEADEDCEGWTRLIERVGEPARRALAILNPPPVADPALMAMFARVSAEQQSQRAQERLTDHERARQRIIANTGWDPEETDDE